MRSSAVSQFLLSKMVFFLEVLVVGFTGFSEVCFEGEV